jgi:hypothetical protein
MHGVTIILSNAHIDTFYCSHILHCPHILAETLVWPHVRRYIDIQIPTILRSSFAKNKQMYMGNIDEWQFVSSKIGQ